MTGPPGWNGMPTELPRVDHIDHIALNVEDAETTADWYDEVLGLERLDEYEEWATGTGPLVISSDDGHTMLALFETRSRGQSPRHIAFRTDGAGLLAFADGFSDVSAVDCHGRGAIVDHRLAYSIYFTDPDDHQLEITTYDYDYVDERL